MKTDLVSFPLYMVMMRKIITIYSGSETKTDHEKDLYTLEVSPDIRHNFECRCHPIWWEELGQVIRLHTHHANFSQSRKHLRNPSGFDRSKGPGISHFRSLIFAIALNGLDERSLFVILTGRSVVGKELRPVVR